LIAHLERFFPKKEFKTLKNILITGVAGFIGSKLAKYLLLEGYSIVGIDNFKTGDANNIPNSVDFILGDCADSTIYETKQLSGKIFDTIIHLAGQSSGEISFDDPVQDLKDNCVSTLNLLEYARKISCKNFIFASSMSVYGAVNNFPVNESHPTEPISMYAVGKLASENYLRIFQQYGISSVALRLFNTYGPGQNMTNLKQGMASIYLAQALNGSRIVVKGAPDRFRDLIYIDDVTYIFGRFVKKPLVGSEVYNVCTGVETKVSRLIDVIKLGLNRESIAVDYTEGTPGDQFGIVGDNTRLTQKLGKIDFVDIKSGVKKFIKSL